MISINFNKINRTITCVNGVLSYIDAETNYENTHWELTIINCVSFMYI